MNRGALLSVIVLACIFGARSQQENTGGRQIFLPVAVRTNTQWVKGLKAENFSVRQGKKELAIDYFGSRDEPVSLGILTDRSGSMSDVDFKQVAGSLTEFEKKIGGQREFFLASLGADYEVDLPFSENRDVVAKAITKIGVLVTVGETRLYDGYKSALVEFDRSKFRKRVLIVFTDADDSKSRTELPEIKRLARNSGVKIFSIVFNYGWRPGSLPPLIKELSTVSAGRIFYSRRVYPRNRTDLDFIFRQIAEELQNEYLVGFRSPEPGDSKAGWYEIEIKINIPESVGLTEKPSARAPRGYYLPPKES